MEDYIKYNLYDNKDYGRYMLTGNNIMAGFLKVLC